MADEVTPEAAPVAAPGLTPDEHAVLVALCRPMYTPQEFHTPASQPEIAAELALDEATVHEHLLHLYAKFGIDDDPGVHRVRLAEEAMAHGAVTAADMGGAGPAGGGS